MEENNIENNNVNLIGKISSDFKFDHRVYGEGFYCFTLEVLRLSDNYDKIPITISERLINNLNLKIEDNVEIDGQFRSYNSYSNDKNKLILTVFTRKIILINDNENIKNPNQIYLNGFVCKKPIYRKTPFGREITDILLAVNRTYNKSDYIPCISWGRNAKYAENLNIGDNLKVWGRIQSREYQKKFETGDVLIKTAYEVSISKIEN